MNRKYLNVALVALALSGSTCMVLNAQSKGGGTTGGTTGGGAGGGATAPTTPTRPTNPTTNPSVNGDRQPSMMDMQRPVFLTGRVMMDDGNPPPDPVVLMLVCNGHPRPQGYSDMKGRFSVTLGQSNMVMADASTSGPNDSFGSSGTGRGGMQNGPTGGVTERQLMGCEFRADLPGFRSDVIQMSGRRLLDNPELGTLILHRLSNVEGFTFSMTSANAPKDSKKAYDKGVDLMKKNKYEEAEVPLKKAVDAYPKYATAWFELGRAYEGQKKVAEAKSAYEQAVSCDAKFVSPHIQLLQIAVNARDWPQIAERSDTVLKLNPFNYPQIWYMNGAANYNLKKLDQAERSAREALKLDVNHANPRISRLLGTILADKGDYPGALDQMRGYLSFAPDASDVDVVRKQITELERVTGATTTAKTPGAPQNPPQQ